MRRADYQQVFPAGMTAMIERLSLAGLDLPTAAGQPAPSGGTA